MAKEYLRKIEKELNDICGDALSLLVKQLDRQGVQCRSKVFYLMKGDYRYLAEVAVGEARANVLEDSQKAYQEAFEIAKTKMPSGNASATLDWRSTFQSSTTKSSTRQKGLPASKDCLRRGHRRARHLNEDSYKDSTWIMQLLRDNLTPVDRTRRPRTRPRPETRPRNKARQHQQSCTLTPTAQRRALCKFLRKSRRILFQKTND